MTLIVTEITNLGIIYCSDRRISSGNSRSGEVAKFLPIHRLKSGLSFFGIAQVHSIPLTRWLTLFINNDVSATIGDFAKSLASTLTKEMSIAEKNGGTGFQIAGYEEISGVIVPTFWFVSNIPGMVGVSYLRGANHFNAEEHFLRRDVVNIPVSGLRNHLAKVHYVYRNGQLFPYVVVDDFFRKLRHELPKQDRRLWTAPSSIQDLALDCQFQVWIVEQIFKRYGKSQPVGGGIETHVITPNGIYKLYPRTRQLKKL